MIVTCAWCGRFIEWKDGRGRRGVSHGICRRCYERIMEGPSENAAHGSGDRGILEGQREHDLPADAVRTDAVRGSRAPETV